MRKQLEIGGGRGLGEARNAWRAAERKDGRSGWSRRGRAMRQIDSFESRPAYDKKVKTWAQDMERMAL